MNIRLGTFAAVTIASIAALGIGGYHTVTGTVHAVYALINLFLSINLFVCYWEMCLYWRRHDLKKRAAYWRERKDTHRLSPAARFLAGKVPVRRLASPTLWTDVWATYAQYDGSYASRRTYGFHADMANGFATLLPSLVLHATFTVPFLPARIVGVAAAMLFWQWWYMTVVYMVSFYVVGRHKRITRGELCLYVWGSNSPWLLFPLLGLYVSFRLVFDGDYSVLGHG
ncbi:MAG: hypothetical protein OXP09_00640 [Gammaproteobacteria bacterium]|nr:hypothetical protein [Gammaproteobacteria bacterium]